MEQAPDQNKYGVKTVHRRTIDGHEYTTTLYPAGFGFDQLPMILDLAGGPAALALESMQALMGLQSGEHVSGTVLKEAMRDLATALVKHGGSSKARELLEHTEIRGPHGVQRVSDAFDACFQGRYDTLFKVLGFVLEVNFVPFWRDALSGVSSRWTEIMQGYLRGSNPSSPEATSADGIRASSESPRNSAPTP